MAAGTPDAEPSETGLVEGARRAAAHAVVDDLECPALDEADSRHLVSVLRLRDGQPVSVTDGRGSWRMCRFVAGGSLVAGGAIERRDRPLPAVCVAFAPVKGDRNEWAVQKLTELGVDRILLMRTERSVVRWEGERADSHIRRLGTVARQAVMQSRGLWLPSIEGVVDLESVATLDGTVLADPSGGPVSLDSPTVLVGPEGGWSEKELARSGGTAGTVSIGPAVLRTETAAVAAGVLLTALRAGLVGPA